MVGVLYTRTFAFINAYRVFLSAHTDDSYWAHVVYWEKQPGTIHERDILVQFVQFVDSSEEGVMNKVRDWALETFHASIDFVEI